MVIVAHAGEMVSPGQRSIFVDSTEALQATLERTVEKLLSAPDRTVPGPRRSYRRAATSGVTRSSSGNLRSSSFRTCAFRAPHYRLPTRPPSQRTAVPVTYDACRLHRNAATPPNSAGSP